MSSALTPFRTSRVPCPLWGTFINVISFMPLSNLPCEGKDISLIFRQ